MHGRETGLPVFWRFLVVKKFKIPKKTLFFFCHPPEKIPGFMYEFECIQCQLS